MTTVGQKEKRQKSYKIAHTAGVGSISAAGIGAAIARLVIALLEKYWEIPLKTEEAVDISLLIVAACVGVGGWLGARLRIYRQRMEFESQLQEKIHEVDDRRARVGKHWYERNNRGGTEED